MNTTKTSQQKGFTIIEVVLVLAIAALIFLMIFVALPALQRGQANSARKNDVGVITAAVNSYKSNNSSSLTNAADLKTGIVSYIDKTSQIDKGDITPAAIGPKPTADANKKDLLDKANLYVKAKCDPATNWVTDGSPRQVAVTTVVQVSASGFETFCQDV